MNYQKFINFKRSRTCLTLLVCTTFIFTACKQRTRSTDVLPPLPGTFITSQESNARADWFIKYKYPMLDKLTMQQERTHEEKGLDFDSLGGAITFFERLIANQQGKDTTNGVRVYFASPSKTKGKCGKLTLIFTATAGNDSADVGNYYIFKNKKIRAISFDDAKEGYKNYRDKKRDSLTKNTMNPNDRFKQETKYIRFSKEKINSVIAELKYQKATHPEIVQGFGIRFTSYTDQDYKFRESRVKHHQRLTIGFTFIDWEGDDIGIKGIDAQEFKERLGMQPLFGDTFDSGDPTPPPSQSYANLDY